MVYLNDRDHALLQRLTETTGLSKTEIFRRALRRLADEETRQVEPGSSLMYLMDTAVEDDLPPDVSARHDHYLYGGGYEALRGRSPREGTG
jgi:hypothetical protein